jgi:putative membrane protein
MDMEPMAQSFIQFMTHFATGLLLTTAFIVSYAAITPQPELKLIRAGNTAAALAVGGATLGFVIPVALVLTLTASPLEAGAWGAVSLIVQLLGLVLTRMMIPTLSTDITEGKIAAATTQAIAAVALGLIQAASWVP